jgi:hypothetical protein
MRIETRRQKNELTKSPTYKSKIKKRLMPISRFFKLGGDEGGRTPDLCIANAALCQTELHPQRTKSDNKNLS